MKTLLYIGAGLAAVLVLAGFGAMKVVDYRYNHSAAGIEAASALAADQKSSTELMQRVNALAKDGCESKASELEKLNAAKPVKSTADIPAPLRDDLALCVNRGIMLNFVKGGLKDAGLWTIIATPSVS